MLTFFGPQPVAPLQDLRPGGYCPHCKTGTRFSLMTTLIAGVAQRDNVKKIVVSYACDICLGPIPIQWTIHSWRDVNTPLVHEPRLASPAREEFDFQHVPEKVRTELTEALDCLSVNAFNGFAAVCRRVIQAICTDLGTEATVKVKHQIEDMIKLTELGDEWKEIAIQIMLSGHDGSHPHLPEVNAERAAVLLSLLQDLTYELYTRPAKVKAAAALRKEAIEKTKS